MGRGARATSSRPKDSDRTFQECRSSSASAPRREKSADHTEDFFFLRDVRRVTLLFDSMGVTGFLTSRSPGGVPSIAAFVPKSPLSSIDRGTGSEGIRVARMPVAAETGRDSRRRSDSASYHRRNRARHYRRSGIIALRDN